TPAGSEDGAPFGLRCDAGGSGTPGDGGQGAPRSAELIVFRAVLPPFPRSARCAVAALALAAASGCGWFESALQVHVTVPPAVPATCVKVSVFTSSDVSGEPVDFALAKRPPGKDAVTVGIYRGSLPAQVFVTARPMFGVECQDGLV